MITGSSVRAGAGCACGAVSYTHLGEKSVYLIERFIRLKPVEAIAIRWHMGGFDDAVRGGRYAISNAFDEYPLAVDVYKRQTVSMSQVSGTSFVLPAMSLSAFSVTILLDVYKRQA